MSLFVNLVGLVLMALVVWWFWLSHRKSTAQAATQEATIIVEDGVYSPASIRANTGQSLTLHFDRRDPSPCAEQVIFQGLDTSAFLETGKTTTLTLDNLPAGKHRFTCQMQMYQGTLIVY